MERYGGASEGSQSVPSPEWGYEESSWQGGESYPQRPGEADCIYFLKNGFCGYASRCRFNHPRPVVTGTARSGLGEHPERVGQHVCQYYMRTGSCKFGSSCKYRHPRQGVGTAAPVSLNYYGYPLRTGEKECSYYVKTGQCKFGTACKFHHPQCVGIQITAPSPVPPVSPMPIPSPLYPNVQPPSGRSSQQYGVLVARPPLLSGSLVQGPYGPMVVSPTTVPFYGWGPYQAPATSPVFASTTLSNVGSTPFYGITQLPSPETAYAGPCQPSGSIISPSGSSQKKNSLPERPDQPECQYYLKTGECKFGPSCRYHHPADMCASKANVILSPTGLPLRPGASVCTHYTQHGVCKFGPACKFDHPMGSLSYSPSASSLADMPVAPYPVGSLLGTLAPSSSSSELRPELVSGSSKESASSRMSSSMSTSTGSVGLTSSNGGPISHSGTQPSVQSSSSLATIIAPKSSTVSYTSS